MSANNPALATLSNPASAAVQAVARLQETAASLTLEGSRGQDPDLASWLTIVQVQRIPLDNPPVGRIAPMLRVAGRVALRAASILDAGVAGDTDAVGMTALFNAAAFARAGRALCWALATRAADLQSEYDALFVRIDAMCWAVLMRRLYADTLLTQREFLSELSPIDWQVPHKTLPIRFDSDGEAVVSMLSGDFLLHQTSWDVYGLAERLAAGTEVIF